MKIVKDVVTTQIGNDFTIVPVGNASKRYFNGMINLNASGMEIWRMLENEMSVAEIADALTKKYDALDREHALKSVREFVDKLVQIGAVKED